MTTDIFAVSAHYDKQVVSIAFGDDECPIHIVYITRDNAAYLAEVLADYAKQLLLTEDEFWGEDE